jgi:hypothetical protein
MRIANMQTKTYQHMLVSLKGVLILRDSFTVQTCFSTGSEKLLWSGEYTCNRRCIVYFRLPSDRTYFHEIWDNIPERNLPLSKFNFDHVRFEVFMAVTMKRAFFWDLKTLFIPHRRHITSPLHSSAG